MQRSAETICALGYGESFDRIRMGASGNQPPRMRSRAALPRSVLVSVDFPAPEDPSITSVPCE